MEVLSNAGMFPNNVVGVPRTHGVGVPEIHGIGINTTITAIVGLAELASSIESDLIGCTGYVPDSSIFNDRVRIAPSVSVGGLSWLVQLPQPKPFHLL